MFGWLRATVVLASSTKRCTNSWSTASSSRICFTTSLFSKPPAPRSVASRTRAIPPVASSFSRTYLPKICGYIRRAMRAFVSRFLHRSKGILVLGIVAAPNACQGSGESRSVTVYVPSTLGPIPSGVASASYQAFGDFEPSTQQTAGLASVGLSLQSLPAAARSMVVTLIDSTWEGVTLVPPDGPVNILALPSNTATSFADAAGSLAKTAGPSMGMLDSDHALVVGGPLEGKPQVAYVVDLGTGGITPVTGSAATYSRDFATITSFAGGALVAGGSRNPSTGATGLFVDT